MAPTTAARSGKVWFHTVRYVGTVISNFIAERERPCTFGELKNDTIDKLGGC